MVSEKIVARKSCCYFCYQNCGVVVHVENENIVNLEGDSEHIVSGGALCPRPHAWKEWIDHKDRLNFPLKRVGERGEGKWEKITWDQALDEISAKIKEIKEKYGPEAIATCGGTLRTDDWARRRFFNLLGSPNIMHAANICWLNEFAIECAVYGWCTTPDFSGSKCIVLWGGNQALSILPLARKVFDCREEYDTKLIVIDPRFSESASKADIWVQLRPGTDTALALAWINVIINEELYDKEFVEKWTVGFDKLKEHVQKYTPEWASEITWVPEETIIESARCYATNKPACILWGVSLDHIGRNSWAAVFAKAILRAITGNLDIPGGNYISGPCKDIVTDAELELNEKLDEKQRAKQLGSDRFKLLSWPGYRILNELSVKVWGKPIPAEWTCLAHPSAVWRAILTGNPYPVKALLVLASNPLLSYANSKVIYKALKSKNLELLVVMDFWMTPTAMLADYVLPSATWLERPVMSTYYGIANWAIASQRPIKPLYERRTDYEFWRELGLRLGQNEYWPWKSLEEVYEYRLKPLGFEGSYDEFVGSIRYVMPALTYKKYERMGFATPSGKVELYSSILEKLGYPPLPIYEEPAESPQSDLAKEYPLILISATIMPFHHSEERQIQSLREMYPEPLVEIHPQTAQRLGIKDGDWVWIETKRGRVKHKAKYFLGVPPQVVCAQRGWWFPEEPGEEPNLFGVWKSNINVLTDDSPESCDLVCGSWYLKAMQCKIYKC